MKKRGPVLIVKKDRKEKAMFKTAAAAAKRIASKSASAATPQNHPAVTVGLVATNAIGLALIVAKNEFGKDLYYTLPFLGPLAVSIGYFVKQKLHLKDSEDS